MNSGRLRFNTRRTDESGAALVTVMLVAVLLLVASIGLLTALGRNSQNSTDVLSETKAYYAAETGLQAAINELRYDCSATYLAAKNDPDMSTWLPYNVTAFDGSPANVIGQPAAAYVPRTGSAYKVEVSDPDNIGGSTTFSTVGRFLPTTLTGTPPVTTNIQGTLSADGKSVTYGTAPNRTTVSIVDRASTTIDFSNYSNPQVMAFRVEDEIGGTGSQISDVLSFEINYRMSYPRTESKTIYGTLKQLASMGAITATFRNREYTLMGSYINLCSAANCVVAIDPCVPRPAIADFPVPITANATTTIWANVTPVLPTRILVKSTGYGPQRSKKILEAIIQRNFIDNLGSTPGIAMLGPMGPGFVFQAGTSSGITYQGGSGPSFGVTDPAALQYLLTHPPGPGQGSMTQMQPPPALISDVPSWQQTAAALHAKVLEYRLAAEGSGTLYTGGGDLPFPPGNHATGTGITFCEGNCKVTADGGGVLVVTGTLTNVGDFDFRGLIIVTGTGGWLRNGGGNGLIEGSVVIAPYDPNNLAAGFLPPRYQVTGGGTSDIIYTELDTAFDGTGAATDFVQGVAEK
ncbi:MAG TPA: hypothetical protein VFZ23_10060 [Pyrinomonadaceae bacterium]